MKAEAAAVAKPVPAIASMKAEPVPQTAKSDDSKEFLYATKVRSCHITFLFKAHIIFFPAVSGSLKLTGTVGQPPTYRHFWVA